MESISDKVLTTAAAEAAFATETSAGIFFGGIGERLLGALLLAIGDFGRVAESTSSRIFCLYYIISFSFLDMSTVASSDAPGILGVKMVVGDDFLL